MLRQDNLKKAHKPLWETMRDLDHLLIDVEIELRLMCVSLACTTQFCKTLAAERDENARFALDFALQEMETARHNLELIRSLVRPIPEDGDVFRPIPEDGEDAPRKDEGRECEAGGGQRSGRPTDEERILNIMGAWDDSGRRGGAG